MRQLSEKNEWAEGIYELRETDAVLGGADGISNRQAAQLAGRTQWLKQLMESHADAPDPHPHYSEGVLALNDKFTGLLEAIEAELASLGRTVKSQGANFDAHAAEMQGWVQQTGEQLATVPAPPGTQMLFVQATAPLGWTKITNHHDKVLRIVSGNAVHGGTVPFSEAFAARSISGSIGATTLTVAQMPSHTHSGGGIRSNAGFGDPGFLLVGANTSATGGNGAHTHSLSINAPDFNVQYVDAIIARKDAAETP